jgi:diaminopimelate epimerase
MRFRKYHGAGNDFVMLEDLDGRLGPPGTLPAELVRAMCDRHKGIGADGVIRIIAAEGDAPTASAGAEFRMDYYNADGDSAQMCGNGIRCLIELEQRAGRAGSGDRKVLTDAGVVTVRTVGTGRITANMGRPSFTKQEVPMAGRGPSLRSVVTLDGRPIEGAGVSMGNPHFVVFVDELSDELMNDLGPSLERHPDFPERTNVEFVVVQGPTDIRMRVWERGIGETQACGSGACAAAVAAAALERTGPHVRVHLPGGELEVEWDPPGDVWLTGPAEEVFSGTIDAAWLEARGLTRHAAVVAEAS